MTERTELFRAESECGGTNGGGGEREGVGEGGRSGGGKEAGRDERTREGEVATKGEVGKDLTEPARERERESVYESESA